jgi:hypothetical protein
LCPPASRWSCCPWVCQRWLTYATTASRFVAQTALTSLPSCARASYWIKLSSSLRRVKCGSPHCVRPSATTSAARRDAVCPDTDIAVMQPCKQSPWSGWCNHASNICSSSLFICSSCLLISCHFVLWTSIPSFNTAKWQSYRWSNDL